MKNKTLWRESPAHVIMLLEPVLPNGLSEQENQWRSGNLEQRFPAPLPVLGNVAVSGRSAAAAADVFLILASWN